MLPPTKWKQQTNGETSKVLPAIFELTEDDIQEASFTTQADIKPTSAENYHLFNVKDRVFFTIEDYSEIISQTTGEVLYEIRGTPININENHFVVKMLIDKTTYDSLNYEKIHSGEITIKTVTSNTIGLRVRKLAEHDWILSENAMVIPEELWFSELFPTKCSVCNTPITYKALKSSRVTYKSRREISCLCPACTKAYFTNKKGS